LILTHLHYDHCSNCAQLPNARIIVQRSELMAAAAPMGPVALPIGGKSCSTIAPMWPSWSTRYGIAWS
jgi:glyoxylase-like metal-dependent hydrolase (beta-lactamase superfamily II)